MKQVENLTLQDFREMDDETIRVVINTKFVLSGQVKKNPSAKEIKENEIVFKNENCRKIFGYCWRRAKKISSEKYSNNHLK